MIQKLQKLHAKKGFTLTELIIVIAILAVMMAAVAAFSQPVQKMVKATAMTSDAITVNEIVGEYIQGRLAYADFLYMFYAVDSPSMTSIPGINNAKASLNVKLGAPNAGKAGVLIFRYVANANEPEKSGYELYDFPITTSTSTFASFIDGSGGTFELKDDGKVFNDVFYGNTQRMIYLEHRKPKVNSVRNEVYMNFEIISYAGDPEYIVRNAGGAVDETLSTYLASATLSNVYKEAESTPPATTTLQNLAKIKKGDSNTSSFVLRNFDASMLDSYSSFRMYPDADTPITSNGSDVMIFYHIPNFTA